MATAEVKLRALAAANASLQALLGTSPFRWWDGQHVQNSAFPGVTVRRVSTIIPYAMAGRRGITQPLFQIDVRHPDPETARSGAAAVINFLDSINLNVTGGQTMPPGKQAPTFVLNQRSGMDFQLNPPVWVQTLDVRLYNLEE